MNNNRLGSRRNHHRGEEEDDYWVYFPRGGLMDVVPSWRSSSLGQNRRRQTIDPWWLFEEGFAREPNYGLPSRISQQLLLIDDYNSRPRPRDNVTFPPQRFEREEQFSSSSSSKLSEEEQKKALNKLRKQFYSPHMSSIFKRLGNQNYHHAQIDDDLKKCAVCLEDFESKCFVTCTPCNHFFHEECIVPWVKSEGKCPVCRYAFVEKNNVRFR